MAPHSDSHGSALLFRLREEEGGKEKIIFKFFGKDGRIKSLGVLILSQCLAVA